MCMKRAKVSCTLFAFKARIGHQEIEHGRAHLSKRRWVVVTFGQMTRVFKKGNCRLILTITPFFAQHSSLCTVINQWRKDTWYQEKKKTEKRILGNLIMPGKIAFFKPSLPSRFQWVISTCNLRLRFPAQITPE